VSDSRIIDGKAFASGLRSRVADAVPEFVVATARMPGLAVVLVGDDPASQVYVGSKKKATVEAGMASFEHRLSDDVSQEELIALVEHLNADEAVDGILVQLPLPSKPLKKLATRSASRAARVGGFQRGVLSLSMIRARTPSIRSPRSNH